ncbi:hypothetical protein [Desulfopila inferna]|uniref:hypothetical protein n=1 Tax=Desulfopila inferna TaxID=468528 RepID=UPI001965BCDD|nr:hypothetical protein [Desulfopila inferna]MBM9603056.1 hypothetical protein [Desulfopila inferna]
MLKGWYYNKKNGQRLLSVGEIADACCCSVDKVEDWFAGKLLYQTEGVYVDSGEVVAFLVRNSMPVSPALLPPISLKILFISPDATEIVNQQENIDLLLSYFKSRANILVENSSAGKFADLTILTFVPDVVVYFLPLHDRTSNNTLTLLSSFPELKTILFVNDTDRKAVENAHSISTAHLIISNTLPSDQVTALLRSTFGKA